LANWWKRDDTRATGPPISLWSGILCGEIVTAGLKTRCQELFGPLPISQSYAMTETWLCTGSICPVGHLHFEPSTGLVGMCDPQTGLPTQLGEAVEH
jgi:acyl-CoA synthetase (AMP-forming)/AMP-acid ligase II